MDDSTSGGLPHATVKMTNAQRLHRLSATHQVEGLQEKRETKDSGLLPQYPIAVTIIPHPNGQVHRPPHQRRRAQPTSPNFHRTQEEAKEHN